MSKYSIPLLNAGTMYHCTQKYVEDARKTLITDKLFWYFLLLIYIFCYICLHTPPCCTTAKVATDKPTFLSWRGHYFTLLRLYCHFLRSDGCIDTVFLNWHFRSDLPQCHPADHTLWVETPNWATHRRGLWRWITQVQKLLITGGQ